jgi:hypothetical protein
VKEFKRVLRAELASLQADGWELVAAESFANGSQESCLLMREHTDPDARLAHVPVAWVSVAGLGPDELRVVMHIVERLRIGRERYGPLDLSSNPKDWRNEATEEFLDGAIYLAMESIRRGGKNGAR